jgi:two-component system sensor histidine kinase/response regulator
MFKGRVLIVDDDKEFLQELRETLDLSGYEVIEVENSRTVQYTASHANPDVIVLDLRMEDMNGFEVAEELKRFTSTVDIPVIAMTGFFREEEHIPLMNICGIKKCIRKPFNPLDVISAIEAAMQGA